METGNYVFRENDNQAHYEIVTAVSSNYVDLETAKETYDALNKKIKKNKNEIIKCKKDINKLESYSNKSFSELEGQIKDLDECYYAKVNKLNKKIKYLTIAFICGGSIAATLFMFIFLLIKF